MQYRGTTALITGASSGLGEQFALDLAARGADLVLVARRADRLEALAHRLRAQHGVAVTPLAADLAEPAPGATLRQALQERGITISTLVNNAGLGATGPFLDTTDAAIHAQISVNVAALVDLTHSFLPDLLAKGEGALVNVASLAAYGPIPQMAVYAATKAFVLHFTEALAQELHAAPLTVLALSPGETRTEFHTVSATSEDGRRFQVPADVVATALRALDARRTPPSVISGRANRALIAAAGALPRHLALRLAAGAAQPSH